MTVEVINRLKMSGNPERIIEALEFVKYNDYGIGTIDFNKITPMPKWVYDGKLLTKEIEKKYGAGNCWYQWCIKNWGTKWNSYHNSISDVEPSSFTFEYQTAWSPPTPVLTKLFEMFPRLSFTIDYIDEGWLYAGTMTSENGELVDHDVPSSEMNSFVYEKFGWEFDEDEDEDAKTTVSQNLPTSTSAKH